MAEKSIDPALQQIYRSGDSKHDRYEAWAETYETDLIDRLGYVGHIAIATRLEKIVSDRNVRIIDIGCGTGLIGHTLRERGYRHIDGADFSAEMLDIAIERGVYDASTLYDVVSNEPRLPQYQVIVSAGLFGFGPPYIEHIGNLLTALQPGGVCLATINGKAWDENHLDEALKVQSKLQGYIVHSIEDIDYITKENILGKLLYLTID